MTAKWTRKRTADRLETEVTFESTLATLTTARGYATADFSQLFNLNAGLDVNDKHITIVMNVSSEAIEVEISSFAHFLGCPFVE